MMGRYILNENGEPTPQPDLFEWAYWMEEKLQRVALTEVGNVEVSTVFLGVDHNYHTKGPPVLWETMCLGKDPHWRGIRSRCAGSREQALAMHQEMVEQVKGRS